MCYFFFLNKEKMMYDSILARSFSKHEQKKLGYGAIFCCFIIVLFFCTIFKPYNLDHPLQDTLNLQVSMGIDLKMLAIKATNPKASSTENKHWFGIINTNHAPRNVTNTTTNIYHPTELLTQETRPLVLCNKDEARTELCEITTVSKVESKTASVFFEHKSLQGNNNGSFIMSTIRPYARKEDASAMRNVREWSVLANPASDTLRCKKNHSVPAILFSIGGYVGNNFHDFSDVIIPLFVTSRHYDREVVFLISDYRLYFVVKFKKVLQGLSNYEPIDIDREHQTVHCFPSLTIGLKRHVKELAIDEEKHATSMKEFRDFLRKSYSLKNPKAVAVRGDLGSKKPPRLLILSRRRTRAFTNTGEIGEMARSLGYEVTIAEGNPDLDEFSGVVNSCDVMMGIHGAGLTNIVFLPENAVFIQVVPIGGFGIQWLAKTDFGLPSKDMNLSYLEYKISREESTLIEQYPIDHPLFNDPSYIKRQGWKFFKSVFLDKQNVKLDVNRFKPTLVKALELLQR